MAIDFLKEPDLRLKFAIKIQRYADGRNQRKNEENDAMQVIKVRIGVHGGLGFKLHVMQGIQNIWGSRCCDY